MSRDQLGIPVRKDGEGVKETALEPVAHVTPACTVPALVAERYLPETKTMTASARRKAAMIRRELDTIIEASIESLLQSVHELPSYIATLEGLIDGDTRWQQELKQTVVYTLIRIPRTAKVPHRYGLNVLHAVMHDEGPERAVKALHNGIDQPRWSDLIRLYRPEYARGNVTTIETHRAGVAVTKREAKRRKYTHPYSVAGLPKRAAWLANETARINWLIEQTAHMSAQSTIPDLIVAESLRLFPWKKDQKRPQTLN